MAPFIHLQGGAVLLPVDAFQHALEVYRESGIQPPCAPPPTPFEHDEYELGRDHTPVPVAPQDPSLGVMWIGCMVGQDPARASCDIVPRSLAPSLDLDYLPYPSAIRFPTRSDLPIDPKRTVWDQGVEFYAPSVKKAVYTPFIVLKDGTVLLPAEDYARATAAYKHLQATRKPSP